MQADPSGIPNDRAEVTSLEAGRAVLAVGPGRTPMHVDEPDLPAEVTVGTWVVLDTQLSPPMVLWVDETMTADRRA